MLATRKKNLEKIPSLENSMGLFSKIPLLSIIIDSIRKLKGGSRSDNGWTFEEIYKSSLFPADAVNDENLKRDNTLEAATSGVALGFLFVSTIDDSDHYSLQCDTGRYILNTQKIDTKTQTLLRISRIRDGWLYAPIYSSFIGMKVRKNDRSEGIIAAILPEQLYMFHNTEQLLWLFIDIENGNEEEIDFFEMMEFRNNFYKNQNDSDEHHHDQKESSLKKEISDRTFSLNGNNNVINDYHEVGEKEQMEEKVGNLVSGQGRSPTRDTFQFLSANTSDVNEFTFSAPDAADIYVDDNDPPFIHNLAPVSSSPRDPSESFVYYDYDYEIDADMMQTPPGSDVDDVADDAGNENMDLYPNTATPYDEARSVLESSSTTYLLTPAEKEVVCRWVEICRGKNDRSSTEHLLRQLAATPPTDHVNGHVFHILWEFDFAENRTRAGYDLSSARKTLDADKRVNGYIRLMSVDRKNIDIFGRLEGFRGRGRVHCTVFRIGSGAPRFNRTEDCSGKNDFQWKKDGEYGVRNMLSFLELKSENFLSEEDSHLKVMVTFFLDSDAPSKRTYLTQAKRAPEEMKKKKSGSITSSITLNLQCESFMQRKESIKRRKVRLPLTYPDFLTVLEEVFIPYGDIKEVLKGKIKNKPGIKGNKEVGGSAAMFGSMHPAFTHDIIQRMTAASHFDSQEAYKDVDKIVATFLDLGSGLGQMCLQVAACFGFKSIGIEIDLQRYGLSVELLQRFDNVLADLDIEGRISNLVEFIYDDFTLQTHVINTADFIFFNNFGGWFDERNSTTKVLETPQQKFCAQIVGNKVGCQILTTNQLLISNMTLDRSEFTSVDEPCSWSSDKRLTIYCYTVVSPHWQCNKCSYLNKSTEQICKNTEQNCKGAQPKTRRSRKQNTVLDDIFR